MNNRWFITAAALLGLFAASGQARAAVLVTTLPSPTSEPNLLTAGSDGPSGVLLASRTLAYQDPATPGFHGTVTEAVIRDATTGGLDFLYQVHTDATATVGSARFTTSLFLPSVNIGAAPQGTPVADGPTAYGAGYTTTASVLLASAGFVNTTAGSSAPDADRSATGIGFQRASGTDLPVGAFGNILFVRTDATAFSNDGRLALIDTSAIASVDAFRPVAVPEPSTVVAALSGLALCGVAGWRRRHRNVS